MPGDPRDNKGGPMGALRGIKGPFRGTRRPLREAKGPSRGTPKCPKLQIASSLRKTYLPDAKPTRKKRILIKECLVNEKIG